METTTRPAPVIGACLAAPAARAAWAELVGRLTEAAQPGGPLEGFVFHGTTEARARSILEHGFRPSPVMVARIPGCDPDYDEGTHWATPMVASFYAEDEYEFDEDREEGDRPVIIAARLDDILACGEPVIDDPSIETPLVSRLGRPMDALLADWEASSGSWQDCYRIFGSFACLGVPPGEALTVVADSHDFEALLAAAIRPAGPKP